MLLAPFRIYPDFTVKPDNDLVVGEPTSQTTNGKQVITYKINPKAVWTDGQPITAKDFEFTWQIQKSADPAKGGCAVAADDDRLRPDRVGRGLGQRQDRHGDPWPSRSRTGSPCSVRPAVPAAHHGQGQPEGELRLHHQGLGAAERHARRPAARTLLDKAGIDTGKKIMTLTRNPKWWGEQSKLDRIIVQVHRQRPGRVGLGAS